MRGCGDAGMRLLGLLAALATSVASAGAQPAPYRHYRTYAPYYAPAPVYRPPVAYHPYGY